MSLLLGDLLHEISNEGARKQFMNEFLEELILPLMIKCAMVSILNTFEKSVPLRECE